MDVLPAPAEPNTIALSRIGAAFPFPAPPYGAAAAWPFIIGTCCACSDGWRDMFGNVKPVTRNGIKKVTR